MALGLAFAVLLGSLCPRGWFLCVHDEAVVLVDRQHADVLTASVSDNAVNNASCGDNECTVDHGCPAEDGCPADACPDGAGCLDLALSLVLDDQTVTHPAWSVLPSGAVIAHLPDLTAAALSPSPLPHEPIGGPPPMLFVAHICLLV